MDIANVAGSIKGMDTIPMVAESLVRQDKEKAPVVTPVTPSNNAEGGSLDQKALLTKEATLSLEETQKYVKQVQERLDKMGTNLQFTIDQKSDKIVVEITSKADGELIRKIPPAQMVDLMTKVDAMVGMLFDGKV